MLNALGLASLCMHVIFLKDLALLRKGIILFLIINRILLKKEKEQLHIGFGIHTALEICIISHRFWRL